jgi:NAD(P)-dependent dehydrogenase (short-subunit alcohol dehydrogenase family)
MNIIITGAGRGIGYETVKHFSSMKGNRIVAVSRNISALQKLSNEIPVGKNCSYIYPVSADLNKKGYEKELLSYVFDRFKKIDILINNAGVLINKSIQQLTSEDFDSMFSVNTKAPFLLVKTLLPYFNKPSHIVNISSIGGLQGSAKFSGLSLYSASKGALAILTECLAEELKDRDIKVNCLALGSVQTEMLAEAFPGYKAQTSAEEMAEFIVNFALNAHKNINGKIIPVSTSTP